MKTLTFTALFLSIAAVVSAQWSVYFMPLREGRSQAYVGNDGRITQQYRWRFIAHEGGVACVLVLTNEATGAFAITAVPQEACQ
jgi:hypothetical protein